ncbi:MAG: glycerophosphodiester phosphodiesterase [Clostridia bacterium]|nr:glycerophosphodiester phosphodiesterase [Clostridia bacterium]
MPFLIILGILILLFIIYLVLIAPTKNKKIEKYRKTLFAHRGLHGEGVAENSISAFKAAVEAGYGIELDVRLSADGELVVFHDDTLERVCGISGKVSDFTAKELSNMRLSGTDDGVPTFLEVLALVSGKVPLLVEIKEDPGKYGVSDKTVEILKDYEGDYIIESFNPLSLGNVAKKLPDVPRGILAQNYYKYEQYKKPLYFILRCLLVNRICKPSFIAYDHRDYKCVSLRIARRLFGAVTFAWTVRSQKEERAAREHGFDSVIFENYIPE